MILDVLSDFFLLREPNLKLVVTGTILLCAIAGFVGCFTFLRKRSLSGDVVAHSVLPGICLAFILSGEKNSWVLMLGALITGLLSLGMMEWISRRKIARPDTALSLMLSGFFGLGIVLLTYIQHNGNAAQAGLDRFIFGKAAAISSEDVSLIQITTLGILLLIFVFKRGLYAISFDEEFARSSGFPIVVLRAILSICTVWVVTIGIQAVGAVLMAALLITPALAARFWTQSLRTMLALAAFFGVVSGYVGSFVSFSAPQMPTGPWIVVTATCIAGISMVLAPRRGILARWYIHRRNRLKIRNENILKLFYQIGEKSGQMQGRILKEDLLNYRAFKAEQLESGLKTLAKQGKLSHELESYSLSDHGLAEAQRIVRLHRLWELYLQKFLHLEPDHVHDDAEAIEHVITPEIEAQLEQLLGNPSIDPHNTIIPPRR
ncbi:MAG: iron chelate uptake ABC transporter family permease subunit [Bacteroidia bacterium]|jgi:manganese/zinc/iron transport system permease protein